MTKLKRFLIILFGAVCICLAAAACAPSGQLSAPQNLHLEGGNVLVWDEVEGAKGYLVRVDRADYKIGENRYDLSDLPSDKIFFVEVFATGNKVSQTSEAAEYRYKRETVVPTAGLSYTLLEDQSGYEVSWGRADVSDRVMIPDYHNGLPVKKIADYGFDIYRDNPAALMGRDPQKGLYCNTKTREVRLPATLEEIGTRAFDCCVMLNDIELPYGVKKIGDSAFNQCIRLRHVTLSVTLEEIGDDAFYGCAFSEITLPQRLNTIGAGAFRFCENLKSITIPSGVRILFRAFENCTALEEIDLPGNSQHVEGMFFAGTPYYAKLPEGWIVVNGVLCGYKGAAPSVLPRGITRIGYVALQRFSAEEVEIPEGVEEIGRSAFSYSTVKKVVFPSSLKKIERGAFMRCGSLQSVEMPYGVESIENSAFRECTSLSSIELPDSVTEIGDGAFLDCRALKEIVFPVSISAKISDALKYCDSLEKLYYRGTEAEWNEKVVNASSMMSRYDIYFYVDSAGNAPSADGKYWNYDAEGKPRIVNRTVSPDVPGIL